jgi:hypothetical protein
MVSAAQQELSEAERTLDKVLGEILTTIPAEKIGVSRVVEDAFSRLRRAKSTLSVLQNRLSGNRD